MYRSDGIDLERDILTLLEAFWVHTRNIEYGLAAFEKESCDGKGRHNGSVHHGHVIWIN